MKLRTSARRTAFAAIAAATIVMLAGCSPATSADVVPSAAPSAATTPASGAPTPAPAAPTAPAVTAAPANTAPTTETLDLLATLPVKGKAAGTDYDRTQNFGSAWMDVDGNRCDTRNDILNRELTEKTMDGSCTVLSGVLDDPYTGTTINFLRGTDTSLLVHIEHIVALKNAWITGGQQMTQDNREALANDPLNLIAVDGPTNSAKGDGDAATWLPPNKGYRCTYVSLQVQVKAKYGLWVTRAEHDAIERVLGSCGSSTTVEQPAVAPEPVVDVPAAEPSSDTVHPGSFCSDVGATGQSDAGKTYTCGGKGADSGGRYRWNS